MWSKYEVKDMQIFGRLIESCRGLLQATGFSNPSALFAKPQFTHSNDITKSPWLYFCARQMARVKVKRRSTHAPRWFVPRRRAYYDEHLTPENQQFLAETCRQKYALRESPLKDAPWPKQEWTERTFRTGLLARKIGIYPMWKKDGTKLLTTVLQVVDNHVINYITPDELEKQEKGRKYDGRYGRLIIGAERMNPQLLTAAYCGLFEKAGVEPKRKLTRFLCTPNAAIQPGTPLFASHFRVGDYVDVYGKTIGHGFQGVVKRWKMKGGPKGKRHGCTKAHRRVGSIGSGREMARVWPGKRMPGHMGQERRVIRALKIWRINTKYNVIYVHGPAVPGHVHHFVRIMDTMIPKLRHKTPPPFPTFYPDEEELPEDIWDKDLHSFLDPTITFKETEEEAKLSAKAKARALRKKFYFSMDLAANAFRLAKMASMLLI